MNFWFKAAVAVALAGLSGGSAFADASEGRILAERWCASCHLVSEDQTKAADAVPPFAEIAGREDFDAGALALFLASPHPLMPEMSLTRNEIRALADYIDTLN